MPTPRPLAAAFALIAALASAAHARPCVDAIGLMKTTRSATSVVVGADEVLERFAFAGRMRGPDGRVAGGIGPLVRVDTVGDLDTCGFEDESISLDRISVAGVARFGNDDGDWSLELIALLDDVNLARVTRTRTTSISENGTRTNRRSTVHTRMIGEAHTYVGARLTATEHVRVTLARIGDSGVTGSTHLDDETDSARPQSSTRAHVRLASPALGVGLDLVLDDADQPAELALARIVLPVATLYDDPVMLDAGLSWRRDEEVVVLDAGAKLFELVTPSLALESSRRVLRSVGVSATRRSPSAIGEGWTRFGAGFAFEMGYANGQAVHTALGDGGRFGAGGRVDVAWVMPASVTLVIGAGVAYNGPTLLDRVPQAADNLETRFTVDLHVTSW